MYIYIGLNCVSPASLTIGFSVWLITGFYLMPCELVQPCLRVHWTSSKWSRQWNLWQASSNCWSLLHWGLMKMANILQSTYSKEFLCISIEIFMIFFSQYRGVLCNKATLVMVMTWQQTGTDGILEAFLKMEIYVLCLKFSWNLFIRHAFHNKAALLHVMHKCLGGNKPLPEPMLTQFIDVIWHQ